MTYNYEVIPIKTTFLKWKNYTYIVLDKKTNSAFIVDPSWDIDKIVGKLDQLHAHLSGIFLTHSHYDHVNMVNYLIKRYDPDVYMSKKEIDYYHFNCSNLTGLEDEDVIHVGKTEIVSLLTPGHTFGGMCYLLKHVLFTGDTIFSEGCGICSGAGASAEQMFDSVQKVKERVHQDVRVFPGHSYGIAPGQTIKQLSMNNIYFQIDKKDRFIDFRMRKKQTGLFDFE